MNEGPDFIIIGAAKAGTTTLCNYLKNHPKIFISNPKEPEFFANDQQYDKGWAWYLNLFKDAEEGQIKGEASTLYTASKYFSHTTVRMYEHLPDVKLIYIIRNPLDRAYSYYMQLIKNYQNANHSRTVSRTFEEFIFPERYPGRASRYEFFAWFDEHLPDNPETVLGGSYYYYHIQQYLKFFPQKQLLILRFENLVKNPLNLVAEVFNFIGVDSKPKYYPVKEIKSNVSTTHFDRVKKTEIIENLRQNRFVDNFGRFISKGVKQKAIDIFFGIRKFALKDNFTLPPPMKPETRTYLNELFQSEIERLENYLNEDLSVWYH